MKNIFNKKSSGGRFYICLAVISMAIAVISCSVGWSFGYKTDYVNEVRITDESEFIAALENSSEIKKRRVYYLTENITLTVPSLKNKKFSFYGKLDGGKEGHSVTIAADESGTEDRLTAPIFETVMAGAEICGVRFIVPDGTVVGGADGKDGTALIAKTNSGYIHDCSVEISCVEIGKDETKAAGMVVENYGKIDAVELYIGKVTEAEDFSDDTEESSRSAEKTWKCYFGGVATINCGTISNVRATVDFSGLQILHTQMGDATVVDAWFENRWIGFICGISSEAGSADETGISEIELIAAEGYWDIAADHDCYSPVLTD